jgi:hypothetical protein
VAAALAGCFKQEENPILHVYLQNYPVRPISGTAAVECKNGQGESLVNALVPFAYDGQETSPIIALYSTHSREVLSCEALTISVALSNGWNNTMTWPSWQDAGNYYKVQIGSDAITFSASRVTA